jgi:hypothetical protein
VKAMIKEHGTREDAPIHIIAASTRLLDGLEDVEAIIHWARFYQCVLIVIDTLNRAMAGGDENSSKDMGELIRACDDIREGTGAHVSIVHHNGTNTGKRGRGHTSLEGAADAMVFIQKHVDGNTAKVTKNKDDEDGWEVSFQLKVVEVGREDDGSPTTSCAVVPAIVDATPTKRRLTGDKATAWDALNDVMNRSGKRVSNHNGIPDGVMCGCVEEWRQEFYARAAEKPTQDARQKAFGRSMTGLRDSGRIAYRDDLVWFVQNEPLPGQART